MFNSPSSSCSHRHPHPHIPFTGAHTGLCCVNIFAAKFQKTSNNCCFDNAFNSEPKWVLSNANTFSMFSGNGFVRKEKSERRSIENLQTNNFLKYLLQNGFKKLPIYRRLRTFLVLHLCSQQYTQEYLDMPLGCYGFCVAWYMGDFCWQPLFVAQITTESWRRDHHVKSSITSGMQFWQHSLQSWLCKYFSSQPFRTFLRMHFHLH